MLVKRKKKKDIAHRLEGIRFTYQNTDIVYLISKGKKEGFLDVSWSDTSFGGSTGIATYSRESIIARIEKGIWKVVS